MATRRGPPEQLGESRGSGSAARIARFAHGVRSVRAAAGGAPADLFDRALGLGCPAGDMRLAYGWRAAVLTAAVVAGVVGLASRVLLTGLFVEFVADGIVPVTGFNVGVTLLATLTFGLVRARRFRLAVHHRLVPVRRRVRRRYVRWRRTARQHRRHRRVRIGYLCRQSLQRWSRRLCAWARRRGAALAPVFGR